MRQKSQHQILLVGMIPIPGWQQDCLSRLYKLKWFDVDGGDIYINCRNVTAGFGNNKLLREVLLAALA